MKLSLAYSLLLPASLLAQAGSRALPPSGCSAAKLGAAIPAAAIGEPVAGVTLSPPVWTAAKDGAPAYCAVEGAMAPVEVNTSAQPIHFRVLLPAAWTRRAAQIGGGGNNGVIPNLTDSRRFTTGPSFLERGFAVYGSDSGHRNSGPPEWALSDEAIKNLAYMQMKKTRDAAMVLMRRAYGAKPKFNYYAGNSQGGREGLTVAQRYPGDYDGVISNVPIVGLSSLMLAPEWIRIAEKPSANWVTPAKAKAIAAEFMRQCDSLDGLADGIVNNYQRCRALFHSPDAWAAKRCPGGRDDPDPANTGPGACLTDGQIQTLRVVYSRYAFAAPLAHGAKTFGMWAPNTDPAGSGLIAPVRFRGQEGAASDAPMHTHLGVVGVTGYLMRDLRANPLDYVEGGSLAARRAQLSEWLDAANPDLTKFHKRGGKMILTIGTGDTLASPGAQLDYYQSLIDRMGQATLDKFARLFVIPQAGHGLSGTLYGSKEPLPNTFDRLAMLLNWVEKKAPPAMNPVVTAGDRSLPLCSYPLYPDYKGGPPASAASYECAR